MRDQLLFPSLSVIIPTYNRQHVLAMALEGYVTQSAPQSMAEILVVDDGSTDDTQSMVRDFSQRATFPIHYFRQCNKGPAAARNVGIQYATSELILFTDSDVIPRSDLVEQHLRYHRRNPQLSVAVQGYLDWHSAANATPFMRWYGNRRLFNFGEMEWKSEVDYRSFYTCNVSLKTRFLRSGGGFDEEFKSAAYEDSELAYRLSERGMRLLYNSRAIGYHHQNFSFEDACRKACSSAVAMEVFFRKEAGQVVLREMQTKQSRARYKLATRFAKWALQSISPLRRLLDSSIPMPGLVYRLFFWSATREITRCPTPAAVHSPMPATHLFERRRYKQAQVTAAPSTVPLPSPPVAK